jgi:hypothetical protein
MTTLMIALFLITIGIAFYVNNRPTDQVTRNIVNILLIADLIVVLLRIAGLMGAIKI